MNRTTRHPYVAIKCPDTGERLLCKEHCTKDGKWVWLHKGREYSDLDAILDAQRKRTRKHVTHNDKRA